MKPEEAPMTDPRTGGRGSGQRTASQRGGEPLQLPFSRHTRYSRVVPASHMARKPMWQWYVARAPTSPFPTPNTSPLKIAGNGGQRVANFEQTKYEK